MWSRCRLRAAPASLPPGVQIATNVIDEGVAAGLKAAEAGADFLDLNCGCPIHEATRRGLGAVLLRRPKKLARLVRGCGQGCTTRNTATAMAGGLTGPPRPPPLGRSTAWRRGCPSR